MNIFPCVLKKPYKKGLQDTDTLISVLSLFLFHCKALDISRRGDQMNENVLSKLQHLFIINRPAADFTTPLQPRLDGKVSSENIMTINSYLHYYRRLSDARNTGLQ